MRAEIERLLKEAEALLRNELSAHYPLMADIVRRLAAALRQVSEENADLWEYVWAMEASNIAMDNGAAVDVARINAAQARLKRQDAARREGGKDE